MTTRYRVECKKNLVKIMQAQFLAYVLDLDALKVRSLKR
jgi:hypothetical protein